MFNGVLLKGIRVIIPKNTQGESLVKMQTGHQGIEKCRLRARETVYWCGINGYIDNMIRKCDVCQHNQTAQPKEEIIPIDATYIRGKSLVQTCSTSEETNIYLS